MANQTINLSNGQQITILTDLSKIFVWNNRYDVADNTNGTGATINYTAGMLMGKISATGKVIPLASAAVDGSQFPVGVLAQDYAVAAGATVQMTFCVAGDVVENGVTLNGADTLATVISGRSIKDRIGADTVGIKLVPSTSNSDYDNV